MAVKEFQLTSTGSVRACIREDNYDARLSKFQRLLGVAQADFPQLSADDVEVVEYAGDIHNRQWGIEFSLPMGTTMPLDYAELYRLWPTH